MQKTKTPNLILFLSLVLLTFLVSEASIYFLDINQLLYKNLSEQLTLKQIEDYFNNQARWGWVKYPLIPLALLVKTTLVAWVLSIGGFFYGVSLSHRNYWKITLQAEFVFILAAVFKILWFIFIQKDFTLIQVQEYFPLSIQSIIHSDGIPQWAIYPLQLLNAFEAAYWVFLVVLINQSTKSNKGLGIVALSYGPALLFWMILIMFLSLNLS